MDNVSSLAAEFKDGHVLINNQIQLIAGVVPQSGSCSLQKVDIKSNGNKHEPRNTGFAFFYIKVFYWSQLIPFETTIVNESSFKK